MYILSMLHGGQKSSVLHVSMRIFISQLLNDECLFIYENLDLLRMLLVLLFGVHMLGCRDAVCVVPVLFEENGAVT